MPPLPDLGAVPATGSRGPAWSAPGSPLVEHEVIPIEASDRTPVEAAQRRVPTGWRLIDATLAVGILVGIVTLTNLDRMPLGVEAFLSMRLSVKNLLLLSVFAWGWPWILALCGLYDRVRLRDGRGEWPRLLLASGIGGGLALIFPLTSASGASKHRVQKRQRDGGSDPSEKCPSGERFARDDHRDGSLGRVIVWLIIVSPLRDWKGRLCSTPWISV